MTKNETASLEKLPNFGILNFESCYGGGYFFTVALTICLLKKPRYDENQAQFYSATVLGFLLGARQKLQS